MKKDKQMSHNLDEFLTVDEVADLLKVKDTTVLRWVREGKIDCYRISGHRGIRFSKADIIKFLEDKRENSFIAPEL